MGLQIHNCAPSIKVEFLTRSPYNPAPRRPSRFHGMLLSKDRFGAGAWDGFIEKPRRQGAIGAAEAQNPEGLRRGTHTLQARMRIFNSRKTVALEFGDRASRLAQIVGANVVQVDARHFERAMPEALLDHVCRRSGPHIFHRPAMP